MCDQTLTQAELPEDVHSDVHGRVVGDSEGTEVHDASEAQRRRSVWRLCGTVLGEDHLGSADDAFLPLPGVV